MIDLRVVLPNMSEGRLSVPNEDQVCISVVEGRLERRVEFTLMTLSGTAIGKPYIVVGGHKLVVVQ